LARYRAWQVWRLRRSIVIGEKWPDLPVDRGASFAFKVAATVQSHGHGAPPNLHLDGGSSRE